MHQTTRPSFLFLAVAVSAAFVALAPDAAAGRRPGRKRAKLAVVSRIETPLGLQGVTSVGANVVIPFVLHDSVRQVPTEIEAQFGVDLNGDGFITDDEYRRASEDLLDPRDTRSNRVPRRFVTSGGIGATHAFVWRTLADLGHGRYATELQRVTAAGRLIPDPAHPGEFLFDTAQAGVRFRVRAVRGRGKGLQAGEWATTGAFSVDNGYAPEVEIDDVLPFASGPGPNDRVEIRWTVSDRDSEDRNGNGVFDAGEDANGNRQFDQEQVGVAFDFHRVQPGEDLAAMLPFQLDELLWEPCTRAAGEGDTDSFREPDPAKAVYAAPYGRQWTFVWDEEADIGSIRYPVIVRARAIDQKRQHSGYAYLRTPFGMDD